MRLKRTWERTLLSWMMDGFSSADFYFRIWSINSGTTGNSWICPYIDIASFPVRTMQDWRGLTQCHHCDQLAGEGTPECHILFKGILVINIASNVFAMSYMKTTENILYCSLIPFEKLCLTKCTEKSFECFLNYFFCFLFSGEGIVKVVVVELNTESIDYISSSLNLYILNIPLCSSPF